MIQRKANIDPDNKSQLGPTQQWHLVSTILGGKAVRFFALLSQSDSWSQGGGLQQGGGVLQGGGVREHGVGYNSKPLR